MVAETLEGAGKSDPAPLAVRCVRALMERHGLPKYRQSAWLADAMGLSYSQAHRKMSGASSWALEELERVGLLFGETLSQVVALAQEPGSVRGVMKVGSSSLDCQMWIGDAVENPDPGAVVAIKTSSGWAAVCANEATAGAAYKVERLEARPSAAARKIIAVLDDDHDLTNSICAHLEESGGYEARAFYKTADLLSSAKVQRFDGYVIDWIVGETSTLKLIAGLRAEDAACPIVVLTAQVLSGVVDEADIAAAVKNFDLVFSEKPVRMSILSATIARAFATGAARSGT
jgi:ActR/RegA family two-component response regulator